MAIATPPSDNSERNMGHWLACPSWSVGSRHQGFDLIAGGDGNTWVTNTDVDVSGNWINYAAGDIVFATSSSGTDEIGASDTLVSSIDGVSGDKLTVTLVENSMNYKGGHDSTPSGRFIYGSPVHSNKIATWYIPNDGFRGYTYQSFTGRWSGQAVPVINWNASAVVGNRVFYGNVDTEDKNGQTVRERSRIYWTPIFKPDEISPSNYKDFGRNDGDEIVALRALGDRLFVLKERNVYVYNISSGSEMNWYIERHFRGVGCSDKHLCTVTKYGVVCADSRQVSLITPQDVVELSMPVRADWQALTFDGSSMSYASKKNELVVLPDCDSDDVNFWIYNFDRRSWAKVTQDANISKTNLIMGGDVNVAYAENSGKKLRRMNDSSTASTATATIKTKQFDFGAPDINKRFGRIYCTYKTDDGAADALTITCYLDGSGAAAKTFSSEFPAKAALTNVGNFINLVGKTLELQFACAGDDFVLDDVVVEYTMMGHAP
tara:strand:+ start:3834 stop:5306 length:1473 start_codon:yes stop_codon:yes gene_type:complete